ncbi:hypothetical protein C6W92_12415 [Roseovarius sp. A46]|nr:hypothetical protein C6W92_12415 [Roseovarius sp. A46]
MSNFCESRANFSQANPKTARFSNKKKALSNLVSLWPLWLETIGVKQVLLDHVSVKSEGKYWRGATGSRAMEWCSEQGITLKSTESVRPWSTVWRVTDMTGQPCILKANAFVRPGADRMHATLSKTLGPSAPALIASCPEEGLFLFEDAGIGMVGTAELLKVYGRAQGIFSRDTAALEAIPDVSAMDVLEHFKALANDSDGNAVNNILMHLETEDLRNLRLNLDAHGDVLATLAARIDAFEPTVNHCDLISQNAARRNDGSVCIIDWDDTIRSAPGWSLISSFSGCLRVYAALRETSLYKDEAQKDADLFRIGTYIKTLVESSAYTHRDLLEIIPIAAIFGTLREATALTPFDLNVGPRGIGRAGRIAKRLAPRVRQVFRTALLVSTAEQRGLQLPTRILPVADMADA